MNDRFLIVNADDFNTDPQRSRGILEAAEQGIVTSTTALANLPWDDETVVALKAGFGAGVGVHLNLTKGRPLTRGAGSLVGADGCFLAKPAAWRRALLRAYDLAEVEQEFAAQIAHLHELGITPSHLDGNNHIHVFPGIAVVVARLAVRFGIGRIRLPLESTWKLSGGWSIKRCFLGVLARRAAPLFTKAGLAFPDHFVGIAFPRPGSLSDLQTLLHLLPVGVTELMCHPGHSTGAAGVSFSTPEREQELLALTHPEIVGQVQDSAVSLISYAECPCKQGRPPVR